MKKILYTGARSGIAYNVIKNLKYDDYYIYATVHTIEEEKHLKDLYKEFNNIECFKLDITDENDLKKIENLDIDILINNAAIGEGGSLLEIDIDRIRANFETNVFSSYRLIQIIFKRMFAKKSGKIIIMSSLASVIPLKFLGAYCGSKASVSQMAKILEKEVKMLCKDIDVILIEPGMYHTGFNQVMLDNKYNYMYKNSYFKNFIPTIIKEEKRLFGFLEKNNFNSITNKIVKAIKTDNPKFVYKAPLFQSVGAKIYSIFCK